MFTSDVAPRLEESIGWSRPEVAFERVALLELPLPGEHPGGALPREVDVERFLRRHQEGRTGVTLMIAGVALEVWALGMLFDGSPPDAAIGVVLAGGSAFLVGEVLLFHGAIGASQSLGVDTTVGWTGVGLMVGGLVFPLLSVGGIACGAVQLGMAGRTGREAGFLSSLQVAPTRNGVLVSGRF